MGLGSPLAAVGLVAAAGLALWWLIPTKTSRAPTTNLNTGAATNLNSPTNQTAPVSTITFSTVDLPDRDPNFSFTLNIPDHWLVEYREDLVAVNLYDPNLTGSTVAKSRIMVQYYSGQDFRQPTNTIAAPTQLTIAGRPAQRYTLKASTGVEPGTVPGWWSESRQVTEVRGGASTPGVVYVFHPAPDSPAAVTDVLWQSLRIGAIDDAISGATSPA